jgi:hypothetical protein
MGPSGRADAHHLAITTEARFMDRSTTSPDDFLASLPDGARQEMGTLDAELARVFEGHERVLWEGPMWGGTHQRIIGYGSLVQRQRSGAEVEWFVVGLAAQKDHLSLYVSAVEDGQYLVKRFADRLGKVKTGSANVTFKRLAQVNLDGLLELVTRARNIAAGAA